MSMRPTSYFFETKTSAIDSFCRAMIYISAVYGVVRLADRLSCAFVLKTYCVKTLGRRAKHCHRYCFPMKKFTPPVKLKLAAAAYSWRL